AECARFSMRYRFALLILASFSTAAGVHAQQGPSIDTASVGSALATTAAASPVPRLVRFSGIAIGEDGKALSGTVGITFAIYPEQSGGATLWMETQNVQADSTGHYSVTLG